MQNLPLIYNMLKVLGPNRYAKITDDFTCISIIVIYCITCKPCQIEDLHRQNKAEVYQELEQRQMEATKRAVERTIDDISHPNQVFSLKAKYKS